MDDGSTDGTASEAERSGARVVSHAGNRGVGAGIKSGYRLFLEEGGDVAVVVAGDGQHDPSEIPRLIGPILRGEADYVAGERLSGDMSGMPAVRRLGNLLLSRITSLASGIEVRDSQYGFTAISRGGLERLDLDCVTDRWGYTNDMIFECALRGLEVGSVASRTIYGARESYIRLPEFVWRVGVVLVRGFLRRVFSRAGEYNN